MAASSGPMESDFAKSGSDKIKHASADFTDGKVDLESTKRFTQRVLEPGEKLNIGIMLDSPEVPAWFFRTLEQIAESGNAEFRLVIYNDRTATQESLSYKLKNKWHRVLPIIVDRFLIQPAHRMLTRRERSRSSWPDALSSRDSSPLLNTVPVVHIEPRRTRYSDYFSEQQIQEIKEYELDVIIRFGFRILRGGVLNTAHFGLWSYHHGDHRLNRGSAAGFWEMAEGRDCTGTILQILTDDLDNGVILYSSQTHTAQFSVEKNKSRMFWKSASFLPRKISELSGMGSRRFFERVEAENKHPTFYDRQLYRQPGVGTQFSLLARMFWSKAKNVVRNRFYFDQWLLLYSRDKGVGNSLWRYKPITPPKDRFWADPHLIARDGRFYVYIEEYIHSVGRGHLSVFELDPKKGQHTEPVRILEKDYHLSYPSVFEVDNELYMVPESKQNKTIDIYRCTAFPNEWEFCMTLMSDVEAVDTTLFWHSGRWWLFTNILETQGSSIYDELFLFSSESLLTTEWTPHPMNPIVSDVRCARPAGRIFLKDGRVYRPSQNCSKRYGYGFNLHEITMLTMTDYQEEMVAAVEPKWDKTIQATHTFNHVDGISIVDVSQRRRKFG